MADNLAAIKNADYKIIGSAPSVNKTQVGNAVVPIPYPVQEDLSSALEPAKDVNFNSDPVYLFNSNSSKVTGDGAGKLGGVVSGTVEAKSEPIQSSSSVLINGQPLIRDGDLQNMQGGNTIGKVTKGGAGSGAKISDDGKIVKDEKGFLDGAYESSGAGKLVDDVKSGDLADKAEQAVNDNIQNTKDILNEQSKRLDELTDAYNKGGTEELYDQAIQSANREIQEAKDVASAVGEKLGNIPDEIGQWSDEVGVKLDKSLDAIKNGNLQYGFGMMAGTAATAVLDVVNPLKKIKWFAKLEDVAVDAKKKAMVKSKNTKTDDGKDGGKVEGDEGKKKCRKIVVDMDCGPAKNGRAYPENVPNPSMNMKTNPENWLVRNGCRVETQNKIDSFVDEYEDAGSMPDKVVQAASRALGISPAKTKAMSGEKFKSEYDKVNKSLNQQKKNPLNMHHIKPSWAGGDESGENMVPLTHADHTATGSGTHGWWNEKLKDEKDTINNKMKKCKAKNEKLKDKKQKDCTVGTKDIPKGEGGICNLSKCLRKNHVALIIRYTCNKEGA